MFIFTAKVSRKKILLGAVAAVLLCGAAIIGMTALNARGAAALAPGPDPKARTNEDRVAYLEDCGWTVEAQPAAVEELLIPQVFDETYTQYLALQTDQGFDLSKYCGKRVKRYAYTITNYPTGEVGVQAGLLVYKNTIVGGEVLSPLLDGFIHGLTMPR